MLNLKEKIGEIISLIFFLPLEHMLIKLPIHKYTQTHAHINVISYLIAAYMLVCLTIGVLNINEKNNNFF